MLARIFRSLFVTTPRFARHLGLAREHFAIADRHARVPEAWRSHLEASKVAILEAAARCPQRRRALIIGAGDCLDVPVTELADRFDEVVLADIVVGRIAKAHAREFPNVRAIAWDATGVLEKLAADQKAIEPNAAVEIFAQSDAGEPPGGTPNLIVSANCISQLGLVPGHSLPAIVKDKTLPERCAKAAGRRHIEWLARQPGLRVLIADMSRLNIGADGKQQKKETLPHHASLRAPDRTWRWNLAPIPEWSADFHRVHEVGAWIDK